MAETQRTIADILSGVPDNTSQLVTPEKIRDIIETMRPRFGSLEFTTPAATTIPGVGTFVKALGTTTAVNLQGISMPVNNRLRYDGAGDVHCHIALSVSFSAASNNQAVDLAIAKNGTVLSHSRLRRNTGNAGTIGSTALHADAMMSQSDYLELFVANQTSTASVTVEFGYLFFLTMPVIS